MRTRSAARAAEVETVNPPLTSPPPLILSPSTSEHGPISPLPVSLTELTRYSRLSDNYEQYIDDINVTILYRPHTITTLVVFICVLLYVAFHPNLTQSKTNTLPITHEITSHAINNIAVGLSVNAAFIVLVGLFVFPSGPFIRPHPLVWRAAFGIALVYEMCLIMLLFQTTDDARQSLSLVYGNKVGHPLAERSYGADCALTFTNVYGAVDRFLIGHFLGWVVKSIMIRDQVICWTISIQWELIEQALQHILPNFNECWWDSWILDVLVCNGLGIYVGNILCEQLELRLYRWTRWDTIPTLKGKLTRAIMQFTPESWTTVRWETTANITRFFSVTFLIVCMHAVELNAFLLKALLWIPPENPLNIYRLIIWAMIGPPALRQLYVYVTDPKCKRIGMQSFLAIIVITTELCCIYKLSIDEWPQWPKTPKTVWIGVGITITLYAILLLYVLLRVTPVRSSSNPVSPNTNIINNEITNGATGKKVD